MTKSNRVVTTEGWIAFLIPTLSGVASVAALSGQTVIAGICSAIVAGLSGLKSFLSTTFADSNAAHQPDWPDNTVGDDAMSHARKAISMISQPNLDAVADGKISDGATLVAPPPSTKTN